MPIIVRVINIQSSTVVEDTEVTADSPQHAVFLADEYRETFETENYVVAIHVSADVSDKDRAAQHFGAQGRGFHLEES